MIRARTFLSIIFLSVLLMQGCGEKPKPQGTTKRTKASKESTDVAKSPTGETVTAVDVQAYFDLYNGSSLLTRSRVERDAEGVRQMCRDILAESKLVSLSHRDNVFVDAWEPRSDLKWQNMRMLAFETMKAVMNKVPKPSEEDVRRYIQQHQEELSKPARYHDMHIFKQVSPDASEEEVRAAKQKMESIRKEIESGLDFQEAARKYSEAPNAQQGGRNVPWYAGKYNNRFEELVKKLKPGEMGPVERMRSGFLLIELLEVDPPFEASLENCGEEVAEKLWKERQNEAEESKGAALLAQSTGEIDFDAIVNPDVGDKTVVLRTKEYEVEKRELPLAVPLFPVGPYKPEQKEDLMPKLTNWIRLAEWATYGKSQGYDKNREIAARIQLKGKRLFAEYYLDMESRNIEPPTEEAAKAIYTQKPELFKTEKEVFGRELSVSADIEGVTDPVKKHYAIQKAQELAKEIVRRARAGEDFAELAKKYSTLDNATSGGEVGWTRKDRPRSPLYDINIYDLKAGEVSDPYLTDTGGYIVMAEKVKEGTIPPFEEIEDQVMRKLRMDIGGRKYEELIDDAYATTSTEFNEEAVDECVNQLNSNSE